MGSKTQGIEFGHTAGVDVTTGGFRSGFRRWHGDWSGSSLLRRLGDSCLFNQKVYVISGDGCMMEGTAHEACAIAGHQKLDNLILFYDDNSHHDQRPTSLAMSEDVGAFCGLRLECPAHQWTLRETDQGGSDTGECLQRQAVDYHRQNHDCHGSPKLAGSSESHGAPLGVEEWPRPKPRSASIRRSPSLFLRMCASFAISRLQQNRLLPRNGTKICGIQGCGIG